EMKGLGNVIVGSGLQTFNLVLPVIPSRQDQNRIGLARGAQPPDDFEAGQLGQSQVDDRNVERIFQACKDPLLAILRYVDCKAGIREARLQGVTKHDLVFYYQYP